MVSTRRFLYIDCLRGVAMIMVVYAHVLSFMLDGITPSPFGQYMRDIMLPLFFFISGFCAYKKDKTYDYLELFKQIKGKVRQILIPTITMFLLFMMYSGQDILTVVFNYDKSGYWFTWVLFQIFLIYIVTDFVCSKFSCQWLKFFITVSPVFLLPIVFHFIGYTNDVASLFEYVKVVGFYFFFLAGVLVKWFEPKIYRLLSNNYVSTLLLITSVVTYNLLKIDRGIPLIFNILAWYHVFRELECFFSKPSNKITMILSLIGKNTLAIYLIHFFLLFRMPSCISGYLASLNGDHCFGTHSCSSLPELLIVGLVSLILCYASIIIKKIVIWFPLISGICFGIYKK